MNTTNNNIDFKRIEQAINYIRTHFKEQPSLDDIAAAVNLSSYHFQRLFTKWAGVSPKKFLQYTTIEYAKTQLKEQKTLFDDVFTLPQGHGFVIALDLAIFLRAGEGSASPMGDVPQLCQECAAMSLQDVAV